MTVLGLRLRTYPATAYRYLYLDAGGLLRDCGRLPVLGPGRGADQSYEDTPCGQFIAGDQGLGASGAGLNGGSQVPLATQLRSGTLREIPLNLLIGQGSTS